MKKLIATIVLVAITYTAYCQNLEGISKQKPFVMHGSIGASASYYQSNESVATRPPWAWNLYGNFSPTIYGIAMPVSFVLNQYGKSYTQPFSQFGISPTYKWAKLHLGYRTISMSPMVFDGQSFRGVGLELNPKLFRFAAFYGKLNRKVNEDTTSGRYAQPQFSRTGYGIKIGIGNQSHFFDLIYFHAKDDTSSAVVIKKGSIQSQENSVIGASFKNTFLKKITWTGDIAASGITNDLTAPKADSLPGWVFDKIFGRLMPYRSSTTVSFGGQTALSIALKNYNTTLGYRRVQPGFKSLGTPYMLNDIELFNWMNNLNVLKSKLNINATFSDQHNNLKKDLTSQMNTMVTNLNVNATATPKLNINFNYSGYFLHQSDGTIHLTDSVRLYQQVHNISLMPSYIIFNSSMSHTISTVINYMLLNDENPATAPFTSSHNLSTSLNYTLGLTKKAMSFSAGGSFNQYVQDTTRYSTYGVNLGATAQFLKNKNLNTQITGGYLINKSSFANAQSNFTFSANVSYSKKHHTLSINANYVFTPYNPINTVIEKALSQAVTSRNFMGSISYNYSF